MKKYFVVFLLHSSDAVFLSAQTQPDAGEIIRAVDRNMSAKTTILESKMIVHGRRASRTISSRSWMLGRDKAFTEYLAPAREKGTKMLKIKNNMWTYSPQTDRIIQISGHMLRQSVMGSDLSYEDMMEDPKLYDDYESTIEGQESVDGKDCWVILLSARRDGLTYNSRKVWIDKERMIPLREELFAKSGKLIKSLSIKEIMQIGDRWYPKVWVFKDELKSNSRGTEWVILKVEFDKHIPESRFSKSGLRK